jgi:hypothetical protein
VIPLLSIYLKECKSAYNRKTCTLILTAALLTTNYRKYSDSLQLMNGLRSYIGILFRHNKELNHRDSR